ncbi:hypothetical protein [Kitasatospora terrestris]|uniref:Uncharacterized protein n=1 Tax=Kitasatospora terrestris TaxID=258051 RepID=A0ABP9E8E4_9ACTN
MRKFAMPRRLINAVRETVLAAIAPATSTPAAHIPPVGLYEPDEIPPADEIAAAAKSYQRAAEQARSADRTKRAAKKILDRLPIGTYAGWSITREPSGRQTADLDKIKAIFKAHGLGDIPMKTSAPTLKVARVETPAPVAAAEAVTA